MVLVQNSRLEELVKFSNINKQSHIGYHLSIKSREKHQQEFENRNSLFLSFTVPSGKLAGYIILVKENNVNTVQLKRRLVDEHYLGIGQKAILATEKYCITELKTKRVWLDVFIDNDRAVHVYKKLGYKAFKQSVEDSREVIFYEKNI